MIGFAPSALASSDPFGFNDVAHCLGALVQRPIRVESHDDIVASLERDGTMLWQENGLGLALVGGVGVMSMETGDEPLAHGRKSSAVPAYRLEWK